MKSLRLLAFALCLLPAAFCPAADLSVTAANVVPGARAKTFVGTAGATLTAGQLVYLDSTASTIKLADADASATTSNVIGITASGASSGQPVVIITEDDDLTVGGTLSMAAPVYCLSSVAGAICPTADIGVGEYPIVVFIAKSTTKAIFKITRGTAPATAFNLPGDDTSRFAFARRPSSFVIPRRENDLALAA